MNARAVETVPPAAPCAPDVAHVAPRLAAMLRPFGGAECSTFEGAETVQVSVEFRGTTLHWSYADASGDRAADMARAVRALREECARGDEATPCALCGGPSIVCAVVGLVIDGRWPYGARRVLARGVSLCVSCERMSEPARPEGGDGGW